jgi:DNA modification methylase
MTAPVDRIERRAVSSLTPYAKNPRLHSPEQVALIAASLREHGQTQLIVVDEAGEIIAGHGRILAAEEISLKTVMVGVAAGWTEAQKRAYRIKDNALALSSSWDDTLLSSEIATLQVDEYDLTLLGFDDTELAGFTDSNPGRVDPEATPEPASNPVVRAGEVWTLGRHRLLCGDATKAEDVERVLAGIKPHLMVTDPPYGVSYDATHRRALQSVNSQPAQGAIANDDRADWRTAWALFPGMVAYIWHAGTKAALVADGLTKCKFEIRTQIIWAKSKFVVGRGHYHVQHEPCWYAVRGTGSWQGDRTQSTLWNIEHRKSETGHSTQKPVECMKRPIENNSSPGQAVYDTFVGSGTTIIAAEMTARCCYAIEIDPAYVQVSIERWQTFTGKDATLEGDGRKFNEIKQEREET